MQTRIKASKALILLTLLTIALQQCSLPSSSSALLQSGSSLLYNARSNSREHIFSISASFNVPNSGLQVAASVSSLQVAVTGGLDFSVRALAGQSYGSVQIVLLINEDNSWSTIRVSYLLSGRSDFFLGFYVADTYLASKYSSSLSLKLDIPNWTSSQGSFTSVVEFSGVRTASNSFSISFSSVSLNPSTGVLTVSVALSYAFTIENIFITYIIFSQSAPVSFSTFNPSAAAPGTYSFIGLEVINSAGSSFSGSSFSVPSSNGLNCVGSGCQATCVTSQACTSSGGQVSGNTCYICASGQTLVNGVCQSDNQCGGNRYWSGTQCLCVTGYISVNGYCYQSCGPNAYIINNQCICIPNYTYSTATGQCVTQISVNCGTNFVLVNGNCICPSPYGIINNLCLSCPTNSYVNTNGKCQCVTGYTLSSTTLSCVSESNCFPNSTPNSLGQCVCNSGYYNQGNQCIPQCTGGTVYNGINCICPTGQVVDSITGQCTYCNNYGQAVQGNTCVCSPTYYPTTTGCAPCTANSLYNAALKQCQCVNGYNLNSNGQCVAAPNCPSGAQWNTLTSACQCNTQGYYIINNACSPCPANSQWNGNACQCQTGYVLSGTSCVSSCGSGSIWNGQTCVCSNGFYLISGSCVACDPFSTYNPAQMTCICNSGYYGNYQKCYKCDASCATCWGPANTHCTSCRGSTSLSTNGVCSSTCPAGQFVNPNNICTACMANCILCYAADSCTTCATDYSISLSVANNNIVVSCKQTPAGNFAQLSLRSYVVGNGVVYHGAALSLMPTDILAAGCSICDQLLLVNIVSTYSAATASVSYVQNSQYWFLITFDFSGAAFIPSFQFTVQINPIYATYFTSAEMAQKVAATINPQAISASSSTLSASAGPGRTRTSPSGGTILGSATNSNTPQVSPVLSNSQIAALFG